LPTAVRDAATMTMSLMEMLLRGGGWVCGALWAPQAFFNT
jgi:hypothetical protein